MYGLGEEVDDEDREAPSSEDVYEEERKRENQDVFVENMKKRIIEHYYAENEENHPRFLQSKPVEKTMFQPVGFHAITISFLRMISTTVIVRF